MKKLSTITRNTGRTEIRMARMTRKVINFYIPVESNWHLLSGSERYQWCEPKVQRVWQLLCLHQLFSGTYVKLNMASINMLRTVEPYVA